MRSGAAVAAIHQPNFFPWLGYFQKIARSSVFILLDDVQFPKTGGTWLNRVRIARSGKAVWLTAPIDRAYSGLRRVLDMSFADGAWRERLRSSLRDAYSGTAFFAPTMDLIEPLLMNPEDAIADYNFGLVESLSSALGLGSAKLVRSSRLGIESTSTQRLIDLTRAAGCEVYLSGGGAQGYQDVALFESSGIRFELQSFAHPEYEQHGGGAFVPGLSIIDALMNRGTTAVESWLKTGGSRL